ncbi:MAG: glycerol acyltransferase [Nocardioidaceae bacterium]|nr:glycerol acyltransferase [Nocardioidaceae bacterium]
MKDPYDTNVVPLGSTKNPGRGNSKSTPSAAARSLAGPAAARKKPVAKASARVEPSPRVEPVETAQPVETVERVEPVEAPHLRLAPEPEAEPHEIPDDTSFAEEARAESAAKDGRGIPLDDIVQAAIHGAQRVLGADWEGRVAGLLAGIRRRVSGDYTIDSFGFDEEFTQVLVAAAEPLIENWFRLEVRGVENIPRDGGALLVANHSGTVPLDGVVTGYVVKKYAQRNLRPLGADLVFSLPFISQLARKAGATLACTEDAELLLASGEIAGVWPEGFKGIGKPFSERYKLQRFGRGGFVSSAMRAGVPIVPVSIVGAEEIYPLIGNVPSLARLVGVPYLPITPFFPLLGPLGLIPLPSKWIIEFGEPIRTDAYEPDAADDPMLLFDVTDQVRETIQQTLYKLLVERGSAFF